MTLRVRRIEQIHRPGPFFTIRIDTLGQLEGVRCGQIRVGRSDGQDEARLFCDELINHILDLGLDVNRLIADRHFGQARQIDQCDV